jgi:hypothetical protein
MTVAPSPDAPYRSAGKTKCVDSRSLRKIPIPRIFGSIGSSTNWGKTTAITFLRRQMDGGRIIHVCEASATLCSRLQRKAHQESEPGGMALQPKSQQPPTQAELEPQSTGIIPGQFQGIRQPNGTRESSPGSTAVPANPYFPGVWSQTGANQTESSASQNSDETAQNVKTKRGECIYLALEEREEDLKNAFRAMGAGRQRAGLHVCRRSASRRHRSGLQSGETEAPGPNRGRSALSPRSHQGRKGLCRDVCRARPSDSCRVVKWARL